MPINECCAACGKLLERQDSRYWYGDDGTVLLCYPCFNERRSRLATLPPQRDALMREYFASAAEMTAAFVDSAVTVSAESVQDVAHIAAGGFHSVIARRDGTVFAWGRGDDGQLGTGRLARRGSYSPLPVWVSGLTDIIALAAGRVHTLALHRDGVVWAWGSNEYGELGTGQPMGKDERSAEPAPVRSLSDVQAIAAGGGHNVVLRQDGTVWAWGINGYGEVGVAGGDVNVPVQVPYLPTVVAVAAGENHSLAIAHDATVWTWGRNVEEDADDEATATPKQITGLTDVVAVAGGLYHSLALKRDGTVWAWGSNYFGQLGDGSDVSQPLPVQVHGLINVVAIATAWLHNIAVRGDGTIWSWGAHEVLDSEVEYAAIPIQGPNIDRVIGIATGDNHAIALLQDRTVKTWGWNNWGQLGNGQSVWGG